MKNYEIIDWERKGNQVRFFLGKNGKQWGDDWNDAPYEHNAGKVYSEFIKGEKIITFGFDDLVLEADQDEMNSEYTKDDFIKKKVPCIVVLKAMDIDSNRWGYSFKELISNKKADKYYFGDQLKD